MKDCFVFVCGPAVGKTYLAQHDDRFVDLDEERAVYKYGLFDASRQELEYGKLNRGKTINHDSSDYILKRMKEEMNKGRYVLFARSEKVIKYLRENNIAYCLVYAGKDLIQDYIVRMKNRGNSSKFIEEISKTWNRSYEENVNDPYPSEKIELKAGQYLSDVIYKFLN